MAVAAGLAFAALGSDTGGSIRFPSACNGLVGLNHLWLSQFVRAFPLANSLDHIGPMTRSVEDAFECWVLLQALIPMTRTALIPRYLGT